MALSFTEGSIGGDIESIDLKSLETFYGRAAPATVHAAAAAAADAGADAGETAAEEFPAAPTDSRIAPKLTASGHAMLWINPHTSYYFRSELQMVSEAGAERVRRRYLGTVLRLPGLQRA